MSASLVTVTVTSTSTATQSPSSTPGLAQGSGPYRAQTAQMGLTPTPGIDTPISAILLLMFSLGALANMAIFRRNRKRGIRFVFSLLLFCFCMARILALALRIVWAYYPTDIGVGIAAQLSTAAGVLLLFVVNLVFTQRLLRAYLPFIGWQRGPTLIFRALFASPVVVLSLVVAATVQSFFTLDYTTRTRDRQIQLFCTTYLAAYAFLPVPLVLACVCLRLRQRVERFGAGSMRAKTTLLVASALLLTLGAVFRSVATYLPRPLASPAWYHGKLYFFLANFVIEAVVVLAYSALRIDRRFLVPDGAKGPGDYARGQRLTFKGLREPQRARRSSAPPTENAEDVQIPNSLSAERKAREQGPGMSKGSDEYQNRHSSAGPAAAAVRTAWQMQKSKHVSMSSDVSGRTLMRHGGGVEGVEGYEGYLREHRGFRSREWMETTMEDLYGPNGGVERRGRSWSHDSIA